MTACRQRSHLACLGFQVRCRCDNSAASMPVMEHRVQHPLLPIDAARHLERLPCSTGAARLLPMKSDCSAVLASSCNMTAGQPAAAVRRPHLRRNLSTMCSDDSAHVLCDVAHLEGSQ